MDAISAKLDRTNTGSLASQLTDRLVGAIASGEIVLGTRLPSERQLAVTLGVSRTTVMAAYRELEARGLVRGQVGRGTFVVGGTEPGPDQPAFAWQGKLAHGARRFLDPGLHRIINVADRGAVVLSINRPALDIFPVETFRQVTDHVLRQHAGAALGLSPIEGDPGLRAEIAARHGTEPGQVMIISGTQQGLDLVTRCLLDPGDVVVMDRPGYFGAIQTFRSAGATLVGWDIERGGAEELETLLVRYAPKFIYTNPTFQNPTGRTMSLPTRRELLRLARLHRIPIIEDDPYRELPFHGTPASPPTLRELDDAGIVIHLRSASKVLALGLRLGWLLAPEPILQQLALVRLRTDISSPGLTQLIVRELMTGGHYDRHVAALRREHRRRYEAMAAALQRHLPPCSATWAPPTGGLHLWVRLTTPDGMPLDAERIQRDAAAAGVLIIAGAPFHPDGGGAHSIRLCFAGLPPDHLEVAIARLGRVVRAAIADNAVPSATVALV
ncbi:MAG TPA: PLP-dependent aminotransferase family protein [Thermomicrobiales bacterium]|nr:PLP-dependent aminotransferase family protein [Thermomicrobiales bacterium]